MAFLPVMRSFSQIMVFLPEEVLLPDHGILPDPAHARWCLPPLAHGRPSGLARPLVKDALLHTTCQYMRLDGEIRNPLSSSIRFSGPSGQPQELDGRRAPLQAPPVRFFSAAWSVQP